MNPKCFGGVSLSLNQAKQTRTQRPIGTPDSNRVNRFNICVPADDVDDIRNPSELSILEICSDVSPSTSNNANMVLRRLRDNAAKETGITSDPRN